MLDLAAAAASDDLQSTVDYGLIAARIVEVSTKERVNLLERLAGRLAQMLLAEFPCEEVRVRVRKLTPPITQAAIDSSGIDAPMLASPVSSRAVKRSPEIAAIPPHST